MKYLILGFMLISFAQAQGPERFKLTKGQINQQLDYLRELDQTDSYMCFRNVSNYTSAIIDMATYYEHFTDRRTNNTYVHAYLPSVIPSLDSKQDIEIEYTRFPNGRVHMSYSMDFKNPYVDKKIKGIVTHKYQKKDGKLHWISADYDLLPNSIPQVRCTRTLFSKNRAVGYEQIVDLELVKGRCAGDPRQCNVIFNPYVY